MVVLFWWAKGALSDFIDGAFLFNLDYAQTGLSVTNMYATLRTLFILQPMSSITLLCISGLIFFVVNSVLPLVRDTDEVIVNSEEAGQVIDRDDSLLGTWTTACLFLAVPIEICFLFLSGRNFGHYFLNFLC